MNHFHGTIPILSVKDVSASIDYYVTKLGFTKKWAWGDPPSFGCVTRDKAQIFLCQDVQGHPGTWMSIFMDDVDALYAEFQQSGAIIHMPLTNMPWGTREMNVADPDGHRLRMGSDSTGPPSDDALDRFAEIEQIRP